jgi:hypothetical protein
VQNIGDPIKYAGLQRQKGFLSRASVSKRYNESQIVLGNDENYMPWKPSSKTRYQQVDFRLLMLLEEQ